ncbi:Flp family type IVb pilin [Pelagibacterium sp. H642]|uniref:Flp family type IVb pilin n=1 Tax=Pelagibacterium sp. H642 TaxID=1881069 RepID=UPI002814E6C9|nr:Flp family type IVb pilin [Pelagibacterium sp. H642]WMT92401.1 Flp family type IVb pilin [Pelagibacterium sp. H642]
MRFQNDQSGATAVEYGLIAALLALIVLAAISILDSPVNGLFGGIIEHFESIGSP